MSDLIDRQAVLKICRRYWHPTFNLIMEEVEKLPSAQQERKGKWLKVGDNSWKCNKCNGISCCSANFCPDCGARMDGDV